MGVGKCKATPMSWDSTQWTDEGEREWSREAASSSAFVQDGSDYVAYLYTKPEHGCTMWTTNNEETHECSKPSNPSPPASAA